MSKKNNKFKNGIRALVGLPAAGSEVSDNGGTQFEQLPIMAGPQKVEIVPGALFQLYAARVAQIDLVHSVRTDKRKVFAEALDEAKVALEVFTDDMTNGGIEK